MFRAGRETASGRQVAFPRPPPDNTHVRSPRCRPRDHALPLVFDCPHCKTNDKLKDDVGGKTATCKNPNCRKVINIPMPKTPVAVAAPADLDAFAAAAFADD